MNSSLIVTGHVNQRRDQTYLVDLEEDEEVNDYQRDYSRNFLLHDHRRRRDTISAGKIPPGTVLILRLYRGKVIPLSPLLLSYVTPYVLTEDLRIITRKVNELFRFYKYRLYFLLFLFIGFICFFINEIVRSSSSAGGGQSGDAVSFTIGLFLSILFIIACINGNLWLLTFELDQFIINQNQHIYLSRDCHWARNSTLINRKAHHPLLFLIQHFDRHPTDYLHADINTAIAQEEQEEPEFNILTPFNILADVLNRRRRHSSESILLGRHHSSATYNPIIQEAEVETPPIPVVRATILDDKAVIREKVIAFYRRYNPSKLSSIEEVFRKYEGREDELLQRLHRQYDVPIDQG